MKLPDIQYRRLIYKSAIFLIPIVTALGASGVIPLPVAGGIGTFLGFITNLLADRASAQQQNDGTLILTGSVQEQVTKGTGILIDEAYKAIDGLSEVGKTLEVLNAAKETAIKQAREVPVIGPLAQQVLDRLK
jgi:hypothetical protein